MSSVAEEIAAWKATLSVSSAKQQGQLHLIAATPAFVSFKYERTPYVKAKVTLTFPDNYPKSRLIVSVDGLVPGLNKKLAREMEQVALKQQQQEQQSTSGDAATPHQIQPVVQYFTQFLDTNRFVSCWKEVRKLVEMSKQQQQQESTADSTALTLLALQETQGMIRLKMTHGEYMYECKLIVNPAYPSTSTLQDPLQLSTCKSNFPKQIVQDVIVKQAKDFVRLLQDGVSPEQAWTRSNPIQLPSKSSLDANASSNNDNMGDPIPSLLPLVSMLRCNLLQLPETNCPVCQTAAIPCIPSQLEALYDTKSKKKQQRPMFSSCGCWFHYKCLGTLLTTPPFGLTCPKCASRAYHTDWSAGTKELERAYADRQARQREMDDVAMMF